MRYPSRRILACLLLRRMVGPATRSERFGCCLVKSTTDREQPCWCQEQTATLSRRCATSGWSVSAIARHPAGSGKRFAGALPPATIGAFDHFRANRGALCAEAVPPGGRLPQGGRRWLPRHLSDGRKELTGRKGQVGRCSGSGGWVHPQLLPSFYAPSVDRTGRTGWASSRQWTPSQEASRSLGS